MHTSTDQRRIGCALSKCLACIHEHMSMCIYVLGSRVRGPPPTWYGPHGRVALQGVKLSKINENPQKSNQGKLSEQKIYASLGSWACRGAWDGGCRLDR